MQEGYTRQASRVTEMHIEALKFITREMWRAARIIAYMQSDGKTKIWEFLPLEGDPTPEEIQAALEKQGAEDWDNVRALIKSMQDKGIGV